MPITQGAGNPKWTREETLLALDLLYRNGRPISKQHKDVIELSALLQAAQVHASDLRKPSFRNVDGVALKIQNLASAIDPSRRLMSSALDREIVAQFPASRANELAVLTQKIRFEISRTENEQHR